MLRNLFEWNLDDSLQCGRTLSGLSEGAIPLCGPAGLLGKRQEQQTGYAAPERRKIGPRLKPQRREDRLRFPIC